MKNVGGEIGFANDDIKVRKLVQTVVLINMIILLLLFLL